MIDFENEIKKFEKLEKVDLNNSASNVEPIPTVDFQKLLVQYDKLSRLYYRVDQDISAIRQETEARKEEIRIKNEEITQLRRERIEAMGMLDNCLKSFADFANVLDRAMRLAKDSQNEPLLLSIKQLDNELLNLMGKMGVMPISALKTPLDPQCHHVINTLPTENLDQKNVVVDVVERGFTFGGKVLKPAKVVCTK